MIDRNNKNERFESYPRPTETDNQLKNQPEYIDELSDSDREKQNVNDERSIRESPEVNKTRDSD